MFQGALWHQWNGGNAAEVFAVPKIHLEQNRIMTGECKVYQIFMLLQTDHMCLDTIQYNIFYFQHRTQLHYTNNFYPTLGWLERGWTEEESYRGPPQIS